MPDEGRPTTPDAWIKFLIPLLNEQAKTAMFYRDYYGGVHRIAYATERFREIFGRFFPNAADNWMQVIVDSKNERLALTGFRFGGPDKPADDDARQLWARNKFDRGSKQINLEAIKCGTAFILVDPTPDEGPRLTGEHPTECYVHKDPATGERLAGIKRWIGDDKHGYIYLYLPDRVHRFKSRGQIRSLTGRPTWDDYGSSTGIPNEYEVVPLIPVENKPDMLDGGTSDLQNVVALQDRVNKLCLDLDVGSEFYAAPQRYATGWEPQTTPQGDVLPQARIDAATSRFLAFKSELTKVGQLPGGDPKNYVTPIEMYVTHIAAQSHIPPHYLLGRMVNVSGDSLKAAETGLVSDCTGKISDFSDPYEEAVSLALKKDPMECVSIWRNPESRTFGQLVDGVVKLRTELALPLEMGWEMVGLTPDEIKRAKKLIGLPERDFQALDRGMAERQREQKVAEAIGQSNQNNNQPSGDPEARQE